MVSICNLYSTVFTHKPPTSQLTPDDKNLDYIEKLVTDGEFDKIVIAWGSSLHSNKNTNVSKLRILKMLMEKGLIPKVKHIVGEFMDAKSQTGTHVLYLGLHNSRESWSCEDYPVQDAIKELETILSMKEDTAVKEAEPLKITPMKKKGRKKNDVLQDSKQACCKTPACGHEETGTGCYKHYLYLISFSSIALALSMSFCNSSRSNNSTPLASANSFALLVK